MAKNQGDLQKGREKKELREEGRGGDREEGGKHGQGRRRAEQKRAAVKGLGRQRGLTEKTRRRREVTA